jgi:hypothetical protein
VAGEILVIENELVSRELPEAVSLWPVVGVGVAIAAFGLLFLVVRPLYARLLRRRLFAGLVKRTHNDGEVAIFDDQPSSRLPPCRSARLLKVPSTIGRETTAKAT